MLSLNKVGAVWLAEAVDSWTDHVERVDPVKFNEENRYIPESVSSIPGYISFDVNPYMREILWCISEESPIREINLMKGVQITYSTLLECMILYGMAHVKNIPMMYMTAEKELATNRINSKIIPMIQESGFRDLIRSSDTSSRHKSGMTKDLIQWDGGGYLMPFGAMNPKKMRDVSMKWLFKDELDGWPHEVGKDGCPDLLSDDRCSGYWKDRKIFRGSTPAEKGTSKIWKQFLRGDQRKYHVRCRECGFPQELRWHGKNKETGKKFGFSWEMENETLIQESVRYHCQKCSHPHIEEDKEFLFSPEHGAEWKPTAEPSQKDIRSYHLPALYSPMGMQPWYKSVATWLEAWDVKNNRVKDGGKLKVFYNNVLGTPSKTQGTKIQFVQVSAHRRGEYSEGQIPNEYASDHAMSEILFLTCAVDLHDHFLSVAVFGWTRGMRCFLIERINMRDDSDDGCVVRESHVWGDLQHIIEEKRYIADNGKSYGVHLTFVDAGHENSLVSNFCNEYESGVIPILGRDRPAKQQSLIEFGEFKTQAGGVGYRITVDHYKDRLAPILRRDWDESAGEQPYYHINFPVGLDDKVLYELTREKRIEEHDDRGNVIHKWHRPNGARNELFDQLVYGSASVEVLAATICKLWWDLDSIDWDKFWAWCESPEGMQNLNVIAA